MVESTYGLNFLSLEFALASVGFDVISTAAALQDAFKAEVSAAPPMIQSASASSMASPNIAPADFVALFGCGTAADLRVDRRLNLHSTGRDFPQSKAGPREDAIPPSSSEP
jgi:hypothetical protein